MRRRVVVASGGVARDIAIRVAEVVPVVVAEHTDRPVHALAVVVLVHLDSRQGSGDGADSLALRRDGRYIDTWRNDYNFVGGKGRSLGEWVLTGISRTVPLAV